MNYRLKKSFPGSREGRSGEKVTGKIILVFLEDRFEKLKWLIKL